ncbi:MAG: hypothetical protein ACQXXC_05220 [Methanolinea tarda]|jgi:hypothetical protein
MELSTVSSAITISVPNYSRFWKKDNDFLYYYQGPPVVITSVLDAFRAAVLKIEMDNTTIFFPKLSSHEETYQNIPEYFDRITSPNPQDLYKFLVEHHDLIDIIAFSCGQVCKRFNETTSLSLEICDDDSEQYLALYVRQDEYQEGLLEIIDEISIKYEDLLSSRSGWFMVTTDFNPPR